MKLWSKFRIMAAVLLAAVAVSMIGTNAEAKIISKKEKAYKYMSTVGSETFVCGVNVKINGKKVSKMKKKVKAVVTDRDTDAFSYHTKSYFNTSSAYATYGAYEDAKYNSIKYVPESVSYQIRFLKPGTYKVTSDSYSKEYLDYDWHSGYVNNTWKSWITIEGKTERFFCKETADGDDYFQGERSGAIYADGYEGLVSASLKKDYKGILRVFYNPENVNKTTYTTIYKVLKNGRIISSVSLGKSKISGKDSNGVYKSTSSSTSKRMLSGNKGKLVVKMGDKNYSITSIIVETYDKDGNVVYKKVGNKKNVTYGAFKYNDSYSSSWGDTYLYNYNYSSMYKPTTVYVGYKNKFTGEYSTFDVIKKTNSDGKPYYTIKSTYKYDSSDKVQTSEGGFSGPCYASYTFFKK